MSAAVTEKKPGARLRLIALFLIIASVLALASTYVRLQLRTNSAKRSAMMALRLPNPRTDAERKDQARVARWSQSKPSLGDDLESLGWSVVQQSQGARYAKLYAGRDIKSARNGFDLPVPGTFTLSRLAPANSDLLFSLSLVAPHGSTEAASVSVDVEVTEEWRGPLAAQRWTLAPKELASGWRDVRLELGDFPAGQVSVAFKAAPVGDAVEGQECLVSVPLFYPRSRATKQPNVLIYLVDALRAGHVGSYGYPLPTTPRLDAFAQDAVLFRNALSTSSWTMPAVASLFTGLEPDAHEVYWSSSCLEDRFTTLAEWLQRGGWLTWEITSHPYMFSPGGNLLQGFDGALSLQGWMGTGGSNAADTTTHLIDWLDQHSNLPFFLYVHVMDVHDPRRPPRQFIETFEPGYSGAITGEWMDSPASYWLARSPADVKTGRAIYDASVRFTDTEFGRLVDALKSRGLYDNTLILFLSDHGEELYDRPEETDMTGGWGHGRTLYEELLRIPLIMKLPDSAHAGTAVDQPAGMLDILPTLCGSLGLETPAGRPGRDLNALFGTPEAWTSRMLLHHLDNYEFLPGGELHYRAFAARDGDYKYIRRVAPRFQEMLFNLRTDPGEVVNVLESNPELAQKLRSVVDERYTPKGFYLTMAVPTFGQASLSGTLETDGRFQDVRGLSLEADDSLTVAPEGKSIHFELSETFWEDTFFFRVEPPAASIHLTTHAGTDHAPKSVQLGSWELDTGTLELRLPAQAPELAAFSFRVPSLLFALDPALYLYRLDADEPPAGALFAEYSPSSGAGVTPDEIKERLDALRAIGYLR